MKLSDYLAKKEISALHFAQRINRAPSTVTRIISGRHTPDPSTMRAIIEATDGEVMPNDFFEPSGESHPESSAAA